MLSVNNLWAKINDFHVKEITKPGINKKAPDLSGAFLLMFVVNWMMMSSVMFFVMRLRAYSTVAEHS